MGLGGSEVVVAEAWVGARESGACLLSHHWGQNKQFAGRESGGRGREALNVGGGGFAGKP